MPGAAPKLPLRSRREKSRCPACCCRCRRRTKGIRISGGGAEPPARGGGRSDNPIKTGNHDDVFFLFYVKSKKRASLYELTTLILNEGSLLVLRTIMEAPLGRGLGLNPEWTLGGATSRLATRWRSFTGLGPGPPLPGPSGGAGTPAHHPRPGETQDSIWLSPPRFSPASLAPPAQAPSSDPLTSVRKGHGVAWWACRSA